MSVPGPASVARRLFGALVRRPADALRPFLSESYPSEPTLFDEVMAILTGVGSFGFVALGFVVFALCSALYALAHPVLWRVGRGIAAVRVRLAR